MKGSFAFRVIQNGEVVASTYSARRDQALKEVTHYAWVYGQDGPVELQEKRGSRWAPLVAQRQYHTQEAPISLGVHPCSASTTSSAS